MKIILSHFRFLAAGLLFLASLPDATAQDAKIDSLIAKGNRFLARHQLEEAHKNFERALKLDRRARGALIGLGKIEVREEDWGKADNRFDAILKRNQDDLEAHHYRGICHRETGKFKVLLLRKWDFDNAEKHFNFVLARDSLFLDTVYQLALLKRYRDDLTEAIQLGHTAVRLRPDLPSTQIGLFQLYSYYLNNSGDGALRWLAGQNSAHARYFIAEKYRRKHQLEVADSLFRDLLTQNLAMPQAPLLLSMARLFYERELLMAGQELFWQAVDDIASPIDAGLIFEDVKYVLSNEEYQRYLQLSTPEEYRAFFRRMWVQRDPTPAARLNVRLAEHFRRLLYAEHNYGFDGVRSYFNNPDKLKYLSFPQVYTLNHEFNDKGLIYLRHGPPDDNAFIVSANSEPNESWRYFATPERQELTFHFIIDDNATGNNWRLTPIITNPVMLEARLHWGSIYYRMLTATPLEQLNYQNDMASISAKAVDIGFDTDRHTWHKKVDPLHTSAFTAVFRAPEGKALLELYYAVPASELVRGRENRRDAVVLEKGMALHDLAWKPLQQIDRQLQLELSDRERFAHGLFVDVYRVTAPPDSYNIAYYAKQTELSPPRLGGGNWSVRLPDFSIDRLAVSDLILAFAIQSTTGEGPFIKNGLRLEPNPYKRFDRQQPIQLYFEVYNLRVDGAGKSAFTVEYAVQAFGKKKGVLAKLTGIFGGGTKPKISLAAEREGNSPTAIEQLGLDLSKADPGEYELVVTITDRHRQAEASATSKLWLY